MLTKRDLLLAISHLATELSPRTGHAELVVVGGGALILLYDAREGTHDLDVLIVSKKTEVLRAAKRTAEALALPDDWLNEAAKGYIHHVSRGRVLYRTRTLLVRAVDPAQLLAMKLMAWRDEQDIADAKLLIKKVHGTRAERWTKLRRYLVPGRETKASYAFDDLWESVYGSP